MSSPGTEPFVPGHQLSLALYEGYVAPILARRFPGLEYAAALIGHGSDVLGFDTARSTDHDWGPRLQVIVAGDDLVAMADILAAVAEALPDAVCGVPVELPGAAHLPGDPVTPDDGGHGRRHGVTVTTVRRLLLDLVGTDEDPWRWDGARWLLTPRQGLLEFTAGPAYRDDTGELSAARAALAWYPHDIWLYVMSGRWQRIAQIESFLGRTAEVGDDLGSHVLAGRIVHDVMHLALLQHRSYAPYPKWLGTAFTQHEGAPGLTDALTTALSTSSSEQRQLAVVEALLDLSRRHDDLQVTPAVGAVAELFFGRPYPVIWSERIARALHGAMRAPLAASLPFGLGGIDEVTDATDALKNLRLRRELAAVYARSRSAGLDDA